MLTAAAGAETHGRICSGQEGTGFLTFHHFKHQEKYHSLRDHSPAGALGQILGVYPV